MDVAIHSRLISFGRIEGGVSTVYEAIVDVIGPKGTIVFPTYTFYLDGQTPYDPLNTPSREVGALPEYARRQPRVNRTLCPLHGHSVIGKKSEVLLGADYSQSIGINSSFDQMHQAGFHLLLLGCRFIEGATFVHHVESMQGVPYRKWIKLSRKLCSPDGSLSKLEVDHYAMSIGTKFNKDFSLVEEGMNEFMTSSLIMDSNRKSFLMSLDSLFNCVSRLLQENSYALVRRSSDAD